MILVIVLFVPDLIYKIQDETKEMPDILLSKDFFHYMEDIIQNIQVILNLVVVLEILPILVIYGKIFGKLTLLIHI